MEGLLKSCVNCLRSMKFVSCIMTVFNIDQWHAVARCVERLTRSQLAVGMVQSMAAAIFDMSTYKSVFVTLRCR
jgi:hypothetical protein